jgi:hypothetical protein
VLRRRSSGPGVRPAAFRLPRFAVVGLAVAECRAISGCSSKPDGVDVNRSRPFDSTVGPAFLADLAAKPLTGRGMASGAFLESSQL